MSGRPYGPVPTIFASQGTGVGYNNIPQLDADLAFLLNSFNDSAAGWVNYIADTGATNAYVATLTPAPSAYVAGMTLAFVPTNSNTGASTINVNSLGSVAIVSQGGVALGAGQLIAGAVTFLVYDGTRFRIIFPPQVYTGFGTDTGSVNAYVVTLPFASASYFVGMTVTFVPANGNTGGSTLNVNGLGLVNIVNRAQQPLAGGEIVKSKAVVVIYDGSTFRIVSYCPRLYYVSNPGNVTVECAGYDAVDIFITYTSGTTTALTLTHLGPGVPVSITFQSTFGSPLSYSIAATDPSNANFGSIVVGFPTSVAGAAFTVLQSGGTVNIQTLSAGGGFTYIGVTGIGFLNLAS